MSRLAAILTLLPCVVFAQNQYADIECVSVDTTSTSKVTIRWQANAVSANQSYTIYKWDAKWNDIAVVNEASSENRLYTDVKAHPFERSERYAISTSIPGQQDSPLSAFHQTIFLKAGDYDKCNHSLSLEWSEYEGAKVGDYTVFGRIGRQPYRKLGITPDTIFAADGLEEGADYNFLVVANLQNGQKSLSNIISYTTFEYIWPNSAIVSIDTVLNRQGKVELRGQIDTATNIKCYLMYGWIAENGEILLCDEITVYASNRFAFEADNQEANYNIGISDFCYMRPGISDNVRPLMVKAVAGAGQIDVSWNQSLGEGEEFSVYCSIDGTEEMQLATAITDLNYVIQCGDIASATAQNYCVRVESVQNKRFSRSDDVCVELQPDVFLPNAFTPNGDGLNDTFGPVIASAQITDFEFVVFDRYGGRVFATTNQQERWNGTCGGSYVSAGGYVYYLKIKLHNGQTIERKGAVNVIYP